jgi:glycerophosphoryl diester phosphodiesterase
MNLLLAAIVALVPHSAADPDPAKAAARVREVIGHRGSCRDRPENTVASVRRAAEAGADAAEVDIRTTKDGALVCVHDADVSRTTDGNGKVRDKTLAEVKKLDAGSKFDKKYAGERVPTLREVLVAAKGKVGVMIDLQEAGEEYMTKIAAEVREHGEPNRHPQRRTREALPEATPRSPADRAGADRR